MNKTLLDIVIKARNSKFENIESWQVVPFLINLPIIFAGASGHS